jgi:hypothetical protein
VVVVGRGVVVVVGAGLGLPQLQQPCAHVCSCVCSRGCPCFYTCTCVACTCFYAGVAWVWDPKSLAPLTPLSLVAQMSRAWERVGVRARDRVRTRTLTPRPQQQQ